MGVLQGPPSGPGGTIQRHLAAMDAGGWGGVTGGFTSRRSGNCCHLSVSSALVSRWFSACMCVRLWMDHERRAGWIVGWPGIGETNLSKSPDCPSASAPRWQDQIHLLTNCWNTVPDYRLPANSRSWHGTRLSWHPLPRFRSRDISAPRRDKQHETKYSASVDVLTSTDILVPTSAARLERQLRAHRSGRFPVRAGARTLPLVNLHQPPAHQHQRVHHASTFPPPLPSHTCPPFTSPLSGLAINSDIPLPNGDNRHIVASNTSTTHVDFRPGLHAPA
jgi:hypothetical protein